MTRFVLISILVLTAGITFLDIGQEVYRYMSSHHVEERPMDFLFMTSVFATMFIMGIVQRLMFTPQTFFLRFVSTLILGWGIAAIVPLYYCILDLWSCGKLNGPMSMPWIFAGVIYYALLVVAILLLTSLVYLLKAKL
jgi:hypothetical protein